MRFAPAATIPRRPPVPRAKREAKKRAVRERLRANLALIRDLTRGRRFLDAGGIGDLPATIAREFGFAPVRLRLFDGGIAAGTDIEESFLAPLEREVLSDRIYDVVFARGCLGRAPDPRALVTNLSLLLVQRGVLYVDAPAAEGGEDGPVAIARRQRSAFTRGGLAELIETAGFSIVSESAANPGWIAYTARLED
jgi:hypothetical protein